MHGIGITNMYEQVFEFERTLAEFTGAPYVVVTDGCTHGVEMCMRYDKVTETAFTPYTYISIPMVMHQLGIKYKYHDTPDRQQWVGEYHFEGTRVWDSARLLRRGMYRPGQMQCLSFGNGKPLNLGRVGAILLDDKDAYEYMSMVRSDGRDLRIAPWPDQKVFPIGYHYFPTLEDCERGIKLLPTVDQTPKYVEYNDCRLITIG